MPKSRPSKSARCPFARRDTDLVHLLPRQFASAPRNLAGDAREPSGQPAFARSVQQSECGAVKLRRRESSVYEQPAPPVGVECLELAQSP
jgi:hypothetical protein